MFKIGDIINEKYLIEKVFGETNIAKTYLASDNLNNSYILKVLALEDIKDWKIFDLFEREIKTLEKLNNKYIPKYVENFWITIEEKKYYIFVQEFIKGENLDTLVKSGKNFSIELIRKIFADILKILNYLHNLNPALIHRDVNPKNIILDNDNIVYLVDFGAVGNLVKETFVAAMGQTFVGTFGYMAPEQLFGKTTPQSDIYSLGVTILFLLTGKDPLNFEYKNMKLDFSAFTNVPNDLRKLLDLMIEPNMDIRISDTQKILDILGRKITIEENSESNKLIDPRVGVSFRFSNGNEVYTLDEFEKTMKEMIIKKELSIEIITSSSNFFKSAQGWFSNYHDCSYPIFLWDKIINFIEQYENKIKNKELINKCGKLRKILDIEINKAIKKSNSEKKERIKRVEHEIAKDTDEKKKKRIKVLFIVVGIFIYIFIGISLSLYLNFKPSTKKSNSGGIIGAAIAIIVNLSIWGSIFSSWLADKYTKNRKTKITSDLQKKIDSAVKDIQEEIDMEYIEYFKEFKEKIFKLN